MQRLAVWPQETCLIAVPLKIRHRKSGSVSAGRIVAIGQINNLLVRNLLFCPIVFDTVYNDVDVLFVSHFNFPRS